MNRYLPGPSRLTLTPTVFFALVLGSGCGGDRADPTPAWETGFEEGPSPAELEDLAFIAEERGWSLDEAIARIGWQEDFDRAVQEIRERYPSSFAGSVITPEGPHQAWVGFSAEVPSDVSEHPAFQSIDVEFRSHKGFSEAELHEQLLRVHHGLRAAGYLDVVSAYELEDGSIDVALGVGPVSVSLAEIRPQLPEQARAPNVRLHLVESNRVMKEVISGGAEMRNTTANGTTACTSGFVVAQGATRGILTAGHCGTNMRTQADDGSWENLVSRGNHQGRWGDLGWHTTTTDTFRNFFQYDTGRRREVYRVGTASKGRTLCRFGRTTGRQCDEVRKMNVSSQGEDRLGMMKNDEAEGGDSGGPWHYGNTAYGIHEGSHWWWFKTRDVWSQVIHAPNAFPNVNVVVCQPPRTTCRVGECGNVYIGCGRTIYCGVCGGCTSSFECGSPTECGPTGGLCNQGFCVCY